MRDIKRLLLVFLSILSIVLLVSCKEEPPIEQEPVIEPYKANTDLSYIYDCGDFTYDVSPLVINENEVYLPDLEGRSRGEIKYILDKLG